MKKTFRRISDLQLLRQMTSIIEELKRRGVVRTRNNPVADYGEYLVSRRLGLKLMPPSTEGYDAIDLKTKVKYQIKVRQLITQNGSRQLGVIRNLKTTNFSFLIAVLFDRTFEVLECYKIPRNIIKKYARYSKHQRGHILTIRGSILHDKKVKKIKI